MDDDDLMWAQCKYLETELKAAAGNPKGKFSYPIADLLEILQWLMKRKETQNGNDNG